MVLVCCFVETGWVFASCSEVALPGRLKVTITKPSQCNQELLRQVRAQDSGTLRGLLPLLRRAPQQDRGLLLRFNGPRLKLCRQRPEIPLYVVREFERHDEKYLLINNAFAGKQRLMPFFNRSNNEDLILAIQSAGVSNGRNGFRKDKSGEKLARERRKSARTPHRRHRCLRHSLHRLREVPIPRLIFAINIRDQLMKIHYLSSY